jgi:hypothetical protein
MGDVGTGTTITFSSSFFAEVLDISGPGFSREAIDTTHMGTTVAKTYIPGDLYDGGELTVEMAFVPSTDMTTPITGTTETVTITFANSQASTLAFSAFMVGFEPSIPLEERMTASATLKVTGAVTHTA